MKVFSKNGNKNLEAAAEAAASTSGIQQEEEEVVGDGGECCCSDGSPPVISMQGPDVVSRIFEACSTWGAFVAIDHGIDSALTDEVVKLGHDFFDLSLEVKQKYNLQRYGSKWRGYMPQYGERSINGTQFDHKEGMYFGENHDPSDPRVGLPTFGTNVYPDDETEVPNMAVVFETYHKTMKELGDRVMSLLSLGLGLESDHLEKTVTKGEPVLLPRMFRYPPQQKQQQQQATDDDDSQQQDEEDCEHYQQQYNWGIGRHSDYGLWTMILTDAPGLEFQHPVTKRWHSVPHVKNGIIMNVGDVLDRLTSGRFISAYHRARNLSSTKPRLSLPFFYDPAWDARMEALPIRNADLAKRLDAPERQERWENTKITCSFDVDVPGTGVEYSEFLAKKVAKVFPDLVPESTWQTLSSTSAPSTRHALTVRVPDKTYTDRVLVELKKFFKANPHIKESHGLKHAVAVHGHSVKAIAAVSPPLSATKAMEIQVASLLHDVDDRKYFPPRRALAGSGTNNDKENEQRAALPNARTICKKAGVPNCSTERIVKMIEYVGCSENKNSVPNEVKSKSLYHLLIPRWADRLEAVGAVGVVRCYQYNKERNHPLCSDESPRATTESAVWRYATPERFAEYDGNSVDMISHYYDKLLHVARPPADIVRNSYLEDAARESSKELVEVCLRFGKTGTVDENYIQQLEKTVLNGQ